MSTKPITTKIKFVGDSELKFYRSEPFKNIPGSRDTITFINIKDYVQNSLVLSRMMEQSPFSLPLATYIVERISHWEETFGYLPFEEMISRIVLDLDTNIAKNYWSEWLEFKFMCSPNSVVVKEKTGYVILVTPKHLVGGALHDGMTPLGYGFFSTADMERHNNHLDYDQMDCMYRIPLVNCSVQTVRLVFPVDKPTVSVLLDEFKKNDGKKVPQCTTYAYPNENKDLLQPLLQKLSHTIINIYTHHTLTTRGLTHGNGFTF